MPNTTSWRDIRGRRPPDEAAVETEKLRIRLATLREQVGVSQIELAEALNTSQSNVSQLERSNDQMLSSIARYVHALGGELKLTAVIGDTVYTLLEDVGDLTPSRRRRPPVEARGSTKTAARSAAAGGRGSSQSGQTKSAVLAALAKSGPMTASQVAAATGLKTTTISSTLSKLTKSGEAVKAPRGYSVPRRSRSRARQSA
ncbi:helix-turn-helix transcriptional regulator [Conexibacter sp. S30A1]|uniref:helix-turn-helix domain-containing protein n=1 Tax=Conexibacter sp. S30A1 TaxID=2937800 RepID=UPI002010B490|nr:helix-turn-helix transcriptional regulator [Conexibacter sp. S30A1]